MYDDINKKVIFLKKNLIFKKNKIIKFIYDKTFNKFLHNYIILINKANIKFIKNILNDLFKNYYQLLFGIKATKN